MIVSVARLIEAAARGSRVGSTSLEFSGQITRSGWSTSPAATRPASATVASTWLLRTCRRWALKSRPSRGTLPCTMATVTGAPPPADGDPSGTSSPAAINATAPSASPAPRSTDGRVRTRHGRQAAVTSRPPATATAKVTSGAPPRAANRSSGESPWLNATRPHGKPPNGVRSRSASCATHSTPVTSGHIQRRRSTSAEA